VIEETFAGVWHGKAVIEAIPTLGDGSFQAVLMLSIVGFVAMIPVFAFHEIERVIETKELHSLLFERPAAKIAIAL
jgi:hypothetical protein